VHAKRGDVIRFTLKLACTTCIFLADSNAGKNGYPQTPSDSPPAAGADVDLAVKQAAGPTTSNATRTPALGMKGHLVVE
jgi:hypothetical protein